MSSYIEMEDLGAPRLSATTQQLLQWAEKSGKEQNKGSRKIRKLFKDLVHEEAAGLSLEQRQSLLKMGQTVGAFKKGVDLKVEYGATKIKASQAALSLLGNKLYNCAEWPQSGLGEEALACLSEWAKGGKLPSQASAQALCSLLAWACDNMQSGLEAQASSLLLKKHPTDRDVVAFVREKGYPQLIRSLALHNLKALGISADTSGSGVSFSCDNRVTADTAQWIYESFGPAIRSFRFSGDFSNAILLEAAGNIPATARSGITAIVVSQNPRLNTATVGSLLELFPNLKVIDFSGCRGNLAGAVELIKSKNASLECLNLENSSAESQPYYWSDLGLPSSTKGARLLEALSRDSKLRVAMLRHWMQRGLLTFKTLPQDMQSAAMGVITHNDVVNAIEAFPLHDRIWAAFCFDQLEHSILRDSLRAKAREEVTKHGTWRFRQETSSKSYLNWLNQQSSRPKHVVIDSASWPKGVLSRVLSVVGAVETCKFQGLPECGEDALGFLADLPVGLKKLTIRDADGLTDESLQKGLQACTDLESLKLHNCPALTPRVFEEMEKALSLFELEISACSGLEGKSLWEPIGFGPACTKPIEDASGNAAIVPAIANLFKDNHRWVQPILPVVDAVLNVMNLRAVANELLPNGEMATLQQVTGIMSRDASSLPGFKKLCTALDDTLRTYPQLEMKLSEWTDTFGAWSKQHLPNVQKLTLDCEGEANWDQIASILASFPKVASGELHLKNAAQDASQISSILEKHHQLVVNVDGAWWQRPFATLKRPENAINLLTEMSKPENGRLREDVFLTLLALPEGKKWAMTHRAYARALLRTIPFKDILEARKRTGDTSKIDGTMVAMGLPRMFEKKLTLLAGEERIPAAREALALLSPALMDLLCGTLAESDSLELRLGGTTRDAAQVLRDLEQYSTHRKVSEIDAQRAADLMAVGHMYGVKSLMTYCEDVLIQKLWQTGSQAELDRIAAKYPMPKYAMLKAMGAGSKS